MEENLKTKEINNIDDAFSLVTELTKKHLQLNYRTFFRGQYNSDWPCIANIFRDNKNFDIKNEGDYIRNCIKEAPFSFNQDDCLGIIERIQHFGGITRLLDFTESIYVALFFACSGYNPITRDESKEETDGCIYAYTVDFLDFTTPSRILNDQRKILTDFCYGNFTSEIEFETFIQKHISNFITREDVKNLISHDHFIKSQPSNERINNQHGLFLWMGDKDILQKKIKTKHLPLSEINGRGNEYSGYISKITIPSKSKNIILKELNEKMAINKTFIYPELATIISDIDRFKETDIKKINIE